MSELASAVSKNDARRSWKFRRPMMSRISVIIVCIMRLEGLLCTSKALEHLIGLEGRCPSKGSASGAAGSGSGKYLLGWLFVSGRKYIVGIVAKRSAMLIQNGNQRLWLIVKDAREGPINATTYETELM